MLTYKDTVKEEIKKFEREIKKAKSVADKQSVPKKINLYQQIYKTKNDLERLKGSLRMYLVEKETSPSSYMPEIEADRKIVKSDLGKLKKDLPNEEDGFTDYFMDTCREITEDIKVFYDKTKNLTIKKKDDATDSTKEALAKIEQKIDSLDQKVKSSWYSMTDSVKEATSTAMGSIKKKRKEMKDWFKEKF